MSNKFNNLYEFDEYVLNAKEKNLWHKNELIPLSAKVYETLFLLVKRHSEVLSKEEMLETIWQDAFVEENNLSQKISILRKTFGNDKKFIKTVPKTGFKFIEPIKILSEAEFLQRQIKDKPDKDFAKRKKATPDEISSNERVENSYFFQRRPLLLTLAAIVFISLSFAGYNYYQTETPADSAIPDIRALTDSGKISYPMLSPDGNSIAYVKSDSPHIFIKNLQTENETEVKIDEDLNAGFTRLSPDGNYIYFRTRTRANTPSNIYKIPIYGGTTESIVESSWGLFDISPDGSKIVFIRQDAEDKSLQLVTKDIYTKIENVLISKAAPDKFAWMNPPSWSKNGKKIAVVLMNAPGTPGKISVIEIASKNEQIIKPETIRSMRQIIWLPSNQELLLLGSTAKHHDQIFRVDYPNGKVAKVTNDLKKYREVSVSADGKKVVARSHNIYSNVWVLPDGDINRKKQITEGMRGLAGLFGIGWTPNNKIIHYQLGTNESQIKMVDPLDRSERILAKNANGISQYPKSTSDGKKVLFQSSEKGKAKIKSVNIEDKSTKILNPDTNQTELYPVISPDDEWIYYIQRNKNQSSIERQSLRTNKKETVFKDVEFSPASFLSISPDGKYLAFNYTKNNEKKKVVDEDFAITIGFIDLTNSFKLTTRIIPASRPYIQFTNGGQTFDYIAFNEGNTSKIFREEFAETSEPQLIAEITDEKFYYFAWSKDEKDLAVSIGDNPTDAILFELK